MVSIGTLITRCFGFKALVGALSSGWVVIIRSVGFETFVV